MNAPAVVGSQKWTAWPWTIAICAGVTFLAGVLGRNPNSFLWLLLMATDWASETSRGDSGPFEKLA
jgi:hypothetical protein